MMDSVPHWYAAPLVSAALASILLAAPKGANATEVLAGTTASPIRPSGSFVTGASQSANAGNHPHLQTKVVRQAVHPDREGMLTIPHWSGSFTYQKLTYNYTMVGTDPKRGSATATVATVLIPLRFVFEEDGTVLDASIDVIDGRTAIQGILSSPIFQPYDFKVAGISIGKTQFADAFARAQFWDSVSTRSRNYHVLLGAPTVAPVYEVFVPADQATLFTVSGRRVPIIRNSFLQSITLAAVENANVSAQTLPIVVWGNVYGENADFFPNLAGFHGAYDVPGGVQTYVAASYHPQTGYLEGIDADGNPVVDYSFNVYSGTEDTNVLSREMLGWLNDPFNGNHTPGWNIAGFALATCLGDLLEVADVLDFYNEADVSVTTASGTYHLADAVFLDYFTRASRSRSANGQYTFFGFFGHVTSPAPPCTGHLEIEPQFIEFPNATRTQAFGINNNGWIVGDFRDALNRRHAFLYDGRNFTQLDYPGASATVAYKINDGGQLVGSYNDADGLPHGFSYHRGTFTPVDFPGSIDNSTIAFGVNSRGDIVGIYDATVEITHGFIYQNGKYRSLDTPFGAQTAAKGISDLNRIVGYAYDDPNAYIPMVTGFSLEKNVFTRFDFPDAMWTFPWTVNNLGMQGGTIAPGFTLPRGVDALNGYVTIYGYPYEIYSEVFGMNDKGQIVGNTTDPNTGRVVGYVATLPN